MQKSKLIELLKGLNASEVKDFGRYVESPFFNKNQNLVLLYQYIVKSFPDYEAKRLNKETILKKVFPNLKATQTKRLSYFASDLIKLLEDYMIWVENQKNDADREIRLIEAYKNRKLDQFFWRSTDKLKTELEKKLHRDINYYYQLFRINHISFAQLGTLQRNKKQVGLFEETLNALDIFYFAMKLKYACSMNSLKGTLPETTTIHLLDPIVDLTKQEAFNKNKILDIYNNFYLFNQADISIEEKKKQYFQLKDLTLNNVKLLSKSEQQSMFIMLLNYCIKKKAKGDTTFLRESFELYKFSADNEILFEDGYIYSPITFFNTVMAACIADEHEWARVFMQKYKYKLNEDEGENIYNLSEAFWYSHTKNFDATLDILRKVEFKHHYYAVTAKYLITICYFELKDEYSLMNHLEAFRAFARRHTEMSDFLKESLLKFISFSSKVYKAIHLSKHGKEKLLTELSNEKNVAYRSWLNEKIEEIKS